MAKGRHVSSDGQGAFFRDSVIMGVGILIIAALTYGAIWLFQDFRNGLDDDGVAADTTTSTVATTATTQLPTTSSTATTTTAPPTTTTTEPVIEVRPPEEVTVLVLNSIGAPGLAARVTGLLTDQGYDTLEPDNYQPELDQSRVWYKDGYSLEALDLAANFPDAITELNDDAGPEADIVVVLGASYEEPG